MTSADNRARDFGLDNLKFVLIIMVVFGHALELYPNSGPFTDIAWRFIYSFHMPAFAFIAGCLSVRYAKFSMANLTAAARTLLIPYLIFQAAYSWTDYVLNPARDIGADFIFYPYIHLWFLPALFLWRMALGGAARSPWFLGAAIIAALGSGFLNIHPLLGAFARAITFLPFFLAGFYLREHVPRLANFSRAWFAPVPLLILVLIAFVFTDWRRLTFFGNVPYAAGGNAWIDLMRRALFFALATAMITVLLRLIPRRESFVSRLGSASMGPYLLHFFLILFVGTPAGMAAMHSMMPAFIPVWLKAFIAAAMLSTLSMLTALPPVSAILWPVLRPRGKAAIIIPALALLCALGLPGLHDRRISHLRVLNENHLHAPGKNEKIIIRRRTRFGPAGLEIRLSRVRFADFITLELTADKIFTLEFLKKGRIQASAAARTDTDAPGNPFGGLRMPDFGGDSFKSPFTGPGETKRVVVAIPVDATRNGFDSVRIRPDSRGSSFTAAGLKFGGGRL